MSSSIERADEVQANVSNRHPSAVDSLPATFRLSVSDVTSSTVSIDLTEIPSAVKSFNIWCSQENEDIFSRGPVASFMCDQPKKICISSLQPATKYTFRAVAYGDQGEVGCSQATLSTTYEGNCSNAGVERDCDTDRDLNVDDPVPDLNEVDDPAPDLNDDDDGPVNERNGDDANRGALEGDVGATEGAVSHGMNNAPVDGAPLEAPQGLDDNFEDCVRVIRHLERNGHLESEFRMTFLTWFCLSSTEYDRLVVSTYIEAFGDDEGSLAAQLVDTFSETISKHRLEA